MFLRDLDTPLRQKVNTIAGAETTGQEEVKEKSKPVNQPRQVCEKQGWIQRPAVREGGGRAASMLR